MEEYVEEHAQTKLQVVGKYLKNTLQIIVSVAFLSIFLSHSSILSYSLFPHSFNVYFSTFLFSLFTHTLERKYMFLVCNGILALLVAKTSVSASSTEPANYLTRAKAEEDDGGDYDHIHHHVVEAEDSYRNEVEEQAGEVVENGCLGEEEDEEESEASVIVEDSVNNGGQEEVPISISTEELNRKIEEFIRKMKEEIRIEAQQQQQVIASN